MPARSTVEPEDLVQLVLRDDLDDLDALLTDLADGRLQLVRPRPIVWHTIAWMIDTDGPQHRPTARSGDESERPDPRRRRCWRPPATLQRPGAGRPRPDEHSTRSATA